MTPETWQNVSAVVLRPKQGHSWQPPVPTSQPLYWLGWLLLGVFPRCSFDGCKVLVDAVHVSRETYLQTKHDFSQLLVGIQSIRVVACPPTRIQNEHEALRHMCAQLVHPGRYSSGGERRGHRGSPWTIREPYRAPPWLDPLRL